MATIVERSAGWQAKIRRKGYPAQSRTFDSKADAEKWARGVEHAMDRGCFVDSREAERTTLAEALERYEREVTPRKKGAKQERLRIALWRRDPLAQYSLANIRGADLAAWRDKRLNAGTSPTTVRNDLALLSHLFNTAIKEWGLESLSNPIEKIKMPTAARARDRRLVRDEETRLLEACRASSCPWLTPVVTLALETAMRQGELLSLTWDNIDLTRRVAHLPDTKNGESRDVPLSTAAVAVLSGLPHAIDGTAFPISQDNLEGYWRRAVKAAEIADLRFHDLRHEATSRLFEKGLNPMEVAAITGHKTLQMLKRYTHLRAEDLAARIG